MASSLQEYIDFLQRPIDDPPLEPDLDDIDEKTDKILREQAALSSGAIRKGLLQQGSGSESPCEGDLVLFHLSVKKEDGTVLETTRLDEDGHGVPKAVVLGKGKRAPRGWELGLQEMLRGERAAFKIDPEYSYAEKGSSFQPPAGMSPDASLVLDIQLVNWYPKKHVKSLGEDGVILRTIQASESWEHPRPPFEVEVSLRARVPSSGGRQGEGAPYFATKTPLTWALGSGKAGSYLEEGISSMAKAERAFVSCPIEAVQPTESLIPRPPQGIERVEYEAELHSMIQVRDLTGTGEVIKRRVREGRGEFPIDCPLEDNAVQVHFKASHPSTHQLFYDSRGDSGAQPPLEFDTGVDAVPEAVDMCIRLMTPNELATVRSSPRFAYDGRADKPPEVPEGQEVEFEIELVGFEKTPHWHNMTAKNKIDRAEAIRGQGNTAFKAGRLQMARQKYMKALKLLDSAYDAESEAEEDAASQAKTNCLTNLALLAQRQDNFTECYTWCEKALRENPRHAKALYRRATNHVILGDYQAAENDFGLAKEADATIAADVDRELVKMKQRQKQLAQRERDQFRNFYSRK